MGAHEYGCSYVFAVQASMSALDGGRWGGSLCGGGRKVVSLAIA